MIKPKAINHLSIASRAPDAPEASPAREEPRLGLHVLDQVAITSFASSSSSTIVVERARGLAEALAGPDGDGSRRRTIARVLAITRSQMDLVDAAIGAAMGRGDFEAVKALTKLADVQARRFKMLLQEHRIELGRDQPVQMFVQHADSVTVGRR